MRIFCVDIRLIAFFAAMAASAPPAYPDDKQWSNAREVVFVVPQQDGAGGAVANVAGGHHHGGGGHQSPPAAPSNSSLAAVKKEMGILTRVCESLLEYIQAQIDTAFHGEYPGKEAWLSVVATVRDQVAAMEDAAKVRCAAALCVDANEG